MTVAWLLASPLDEGVLRQIIGVCVGAAVSGLVFLIGFVAVLRRLTDKEIPAQLASINSKFETFDRHVAEIGKELIQMRRDLDRHGYQIEVLEEWRTRDLDDTRTGGRTRVSPRTRG